MPPFPVIVLFQGFFARRFSAGYLAFAYFWVRGELGLAVGTLFHPGPPLKKRNHTNQTNQRTKMNKEDQKERIINFSFFMNYTNYKKVFLNQDEEENSNAERIIRKNKNGIK